MVREDALVRPSMGRLLGASTDVILAMLFVVTSAFAVAALPDGSTLRLALSVPVLLVAPGYLLLQALLVPARPAGQRWLHAFVSVGLTPAIVGLLAVSMAWIWDGLTPQGIVTTVTVACMAFAAIALYRRWGATVPPLDTGESVPTEAPTVDATIPAPVQATEIASES
jgi:uncharacterized membrane protein